MKSLIRLLVAAMIASGLAVGTSLVTEPAQARAWRPNPGAMFNLPRSGKRLKLENQVRAAIRHAHKGSSIKIAVFSFDRKPVAKDLIRAHRRGVHVQVLANDHAYTGAEHMLRRALGGRLSHKNFFHRCTHGCRSFGGFLHTKFFMFSHTGGARNTVMLGSLNFTWNSVNNQYNDLWVSKPNSNIYPWFDDLFTQMAKDKAAPRQKPHHPLNEIWPTGGRKWETQKQISRILTRSPKRGFLTLQSMPWPHQSRRNDPIMKILNRVHCYGARGGTGGSGHRTIVRVSMHAWHTKRGIWLANKFRQLYADGCHVQLMYGLAGRDTRKAFAKRTRHGYLPVHSNGYDTNGDGDIDLYSHQKELMISGHYGSQHAFRMVVTGSSNYSSTDLRGDQILFLIHRHAAYNAYTRNFKYIWNHRSFRVRYIPYGRSARLAMNGRMSLAAAEDLPGVESVAQSVAQAPRAAGPAWEND